MVQIRPARPGDAAAITAILNVAIRETTAVWHCTQTNEAERAAWLETQREAGRPVLVAVDAADDVLGYASYGPWRDFDGYRHTVEDSIYVRENAQGKGIGRALLAALVAQARQAGVRVIVGAIEAGNAASIAIHERLGFRVVGKFSQVGTKFGRWLDLTFVELRVGSDEAMLPG